MNKRAFIPSLLLPVITILQAVGCFFSLAILFKQQKKDFRSTNSLNLHKEEEEGKEASRVHLEDLSLQVAALVGVVEVSTRKEQKKKRRKKNFEHVQPISDFCARSSWKRSFQK